MGECFVFQRTWQSENGTQQVVEGAIMKAWGMNLVKDNKTGGAAAGAKAKPKARPKSKSSLPAVVKDKDEAKPKANNVVSPDSGANALFVCPGCNDSSSKSRPEVRARWCVPQRASSSPIYRFERHQPSSTSSLLLLLLCLLLAFCRSCSPTSAPARPPSLTPRTASTAGRRRPDRSAPTALSLASS